MKWSQYLRTDEGKQLEAQTAQLSDSLNRITVNGDVTTMYFLCKDTACRSTLIDTAALPLLKGITWCGALRNNRDEIYIHATINGQTQSLHRLIAGNPPTGIIDHINGESLDNRRCNLQNTSQRKNMLKKDRYKNTDIERNISKSGDKYKVQFIRRFNTLEAAQLAARIIRETLDKYVETEPVIMK